MGCTTPPLILCLEITKSLMLLSKNGSVHLSSARPLHKDQGDTSPLSGAPCPPHRWATSCRSARQRWVSGTWLGEARSQLRSVTTLRAGDEKGGECPAAARGGTSGLAITRPRRGTAPLCCPRPARRPEAAGSAETAAQLRHVPSPFAGSPTSRIAAAAAMKPPAATTSSPDRAEAGSEAAQRGGGRGGHGRAAPSA